MSKADLVNISEASRQLGVSRQTLYRYIAEGLIHTKHHGVYHCITTAEMARLKRSMRKVQIGSKLVPVLDGKAPPDVV